MDSSILLNAREVCKCSIFAIFTKKIFMPRYFIRLAYNGTSYHGWQVQPNASTVQEKLNYALSTYLREPIETIGAGRTDTGVHASYFIAHFDSTAPNLEGCSNTIHKINCILPKDIVVYSIKEVSEGANARFDAISRTYNYFLHTDKSCFTNEFSTHFRGKLDVEAIRSAIPILFKHTDFTSFSKLHTDVKTNNCSISHAEWIEYAPGKYVFVVRADRFLRNMVRAIVGTLLEVGKGKLRPEELDTIIAAKDRSLAGTSAHSQGLFLAHIAYPKEVYAEDQHPDQSFPAFIIP